MPLSLALLTRQVFSTMPNVFSKPSVFQVFYIYFLVWVFSEDNVTSKTQGRPAKNKAVFL